MKTQKATQNKADYDRVVKLVREAKKEAEKFIQKSKLDTPHIRTKYL